MDEYREAQREKWLKAQEAKQAEASGSGEASSSAASSGAAGSSNVANTSSNGADTTSRAAEAPRPVVATATDQSPADGSTPSVRRVHILPVGSAPEGPTERRLELVAPILRDMRSSQKLIKTGLYLRPSEHEFIVVKSEPQEGLINTDTDFFVEGDPISRYEKVQFICLWDFETASRDQDPSSLFTDFIGPYFKSMSESGEDSANVVVVGDVIKMFDLEFQVMATEPSPPEIGIIDTDTLVFVDWDSTPEFGRIHIVPFQDTLPHAYEFDVFNDYVKPYLTRNKLLRLSVNDQFTYQGVQFKVVCCEPNGPARIGRNTTIFCEGVLHPSLRNLLPPELLEQLSHLPPGLQMLLLNTEALAGGYEERLMEVQEMLSRRRGLANETIDRVETLRWHDSAESQKQCMICLSDFSEGEEVRKLPCGHVFHVGCIDEWLRRCTDCPICKANVDRAVRQY